MSFRATERSYDALPLAAVPAVAIDTETTGLDVAHDRLVEIGAVRLGAKGPGEQFAALVAPGMAIPPAATAVHGITDADVADAEAFPQVMRAMTGWIGNAVVVGYAVGFDLAVLRAEHERHGLPWTPPRSLCVRHLLQLVAPELPTRSLELAASWLGVEPGKRHRALGDALTAGYIFRALLPRLRAKGIVTLAQAERACRSRSARQEEAQAGWHEVERDSRLVRESVAEYARVDSFPYRHRVADLMRRPPVVVAGSRSLREALALMMELGISSVFVEPPAASGADAGSAAGPAAGQGVEAGADPDAAWGILTERDILRAVNAAGAAALERPVADYAKGPLVSVDSDEFVYRALAGMARRGFRHLAVRDAGGALVGALSARDLLRQRAADALSLGDSLERAESPDDLGRIWSGLTTVARGLFLEETDPRDIAAIISRELRALTKRACVLAEADLQGEGAGGPPRPYALLVLGSGGRGESLLAMDQDNAIVFDEGEPGGPEDRWFERLGTRVSDMLHEAGVSYCNGGIMASRPDWRLDLGGWRRRIGTWIDQSHPKDLLNSDIFFDAVAVHGDRALADTLLAEARAAARGSRLFLGAMALNASRFRAGLNWRGRPRLTDGRIDLKMSGLLPIFSAARVAALTHGIAARSTPERLEAVRALDLVDAALIGRLVEAHRIMLGCILRQQLRDVQVGVALSNRVAPDEMEPHETQQLTWALEQVDSARTLLGTPEFHWA